MIEKISKRRIPYRVASFWIVSCENGFWGAGGGGGRIVPGEKRKDLQEMQPERHLRVSCSLNLTFCCMCLDWDS